MRLATAALFVAAAIPSHHHLATAFAPAKRTSIVPALASRQPNGQHFSPSLLFSAQDDNDNGGISGDDETAPPANDVNPYADPNYPELEFVNYDDPDYRVDQGLSDGDEFFPTSSREEANRATLEEIEAMREERRRRNDEFQFETYHAQVLRGGEVCLGEWTVFRTDTFMKGEELERIGGGGGRHPEAGNVPRLWKWEKVLKVVSRGEKRILDGDAEWRVDGERLVHGERLASADDFPSLMNKGNEEEEEDELAWEEEDVMHVSNTYWPEEMTSLDFRGEGGNMCVGKAYTICDATPLSTTQTQQSAEASLSNRHEGPFREMRTELGIQENGMRFRIKLDYSLLDDDIENVEGPSTKTLPPPPLHLRTLTVCRETLDGYWPRASDNGKDASRKKQDLIDRALFGPPGAPGGLYDPPPVGSEKRAVENYMLLQFEGGVTALLPHRLDQYESFTDDLDGSTLFLTEGESSPGWVTSLDWTPGPIRYQVDRKVMSGTKLKGLRTLELSEVRGEDADRWRPKDGGANMRQ